METKQKIKILEKERNNEGINYVSEKNEEKIEKRSRQ